MISLEQLTDASPSARNFEALMRLVPDSGGQSVVFRFGTGSAVFTAAQTSATVVVNHGLGKTPVFAIAGARDNLLSYIVAGRSATTISVIGFVTSNVATTATRTFDWLVIG